MRIVSQIKYVILAVIAAACFAIASSAQVEVAITIAPPDLPVYDQPVCPDDGYIWVPGYWAWDDGYYWVPGTWVLAPEPEYLWTPGYWAWGGNGFIFHEGYWGPSVGFYGGVNYGFGYFGHGYEGGRWEDGHFFYNRAVNNVNVTVVHNVYNTTVVNNTSVSRVSYNGGNGGITARPNAEEEAAMHERHLPRVAAQTEHLQAARSDQQMRASVNQGKPPIAATPTAAALHGQGVVAARQGGAVHGTSRGAASQSAVHPNELPPLQHPSAPNTGQPERDQKYQQEQEKLFSKQNEDRQKLQAKQEQEHQQLQKKNADDSKRQQMEERHQQQTQSMVQKHVQQQQRLESKNSNRSRLLAQEEDLLMETRKQGSRISVRSSHSVATCAPSTGWLAAGCAILDK